MRLLRRCVLPQNQVGKQKGSGNGYGSDSRKGRGVWPRREHQSQQPNRAADSEIASVKVNMTREFEATANETSISTDSRGESSSTHTNQNNSSQRRIGSRAARRQFSGEINARARRLFSRGDLIEASSVLRTAIEEFPFDTHLLTLAGAVESKLGNLQLARDVLRRAAHFAHKGDSFPAIALASVELRLGNAASAMQIIEDGIARKHDDVGLVLARVHIAMKAKTLYRGSFVRSILIEAEKLFPEDASLLRQYALFESQQKKFSVAKDLLRRAIRSDPTHAQSWLALAMLESRNDTKMGNEAARDILRKAVREMKASVSSHAPLLAAWANLEDKLGDRRRAMWLLSNCREREGFSGQTMLQWAMIMGKGKMEWERKMARCLLEEAVEKYPKDAHIKHALAIMCRRNGEWNRAKELFEENVSLDPNNIYSWCGLGMLLLSQGELEEAEKTFLKGVGRSTVDELIADSKKLNTFQTGMNPPTDRSKEKFDLKKKHAKCIFHLAQISSSKYGVEVTRELYTIANFLDPKDSTIQFQWACLEKNQGNLEFARELFTECAQRSPTKSRTFLNWGIMERRAGNYEAATTLFQRGLKIHRNSTPLWITWSVTERMRGSMEESRAVLERGVKCCRRHLPIWIELSQLELQMSGPKAAQRILDRAAKASPSFLKDEDFVEARLYMSKKADDDGGTY